MKAEIAIIAGGQGTRIASVASDIPKSMIPINGKPVVEYQLELAKRYGYTNILFIIGHLGEQIRDYFGNGDKWGVNIEYFVERDPLGTAGALPLVSNKLTETFFVFYGDTIMDIDLEMMMRFHKDNLADLTLFAHPNDHPFDSDLVKVDNNSMVEEFILKPHFGLNVYRNLVNAALYVMDKSCLNFIPNGKCAMEKGLFPRLLAANKNLKAYISPEYIKDMGTPDRWQQVTNDIESGKVARLNRKFKRKAIFLDRDGVICKEVNLLHKLEQIELIEGAAEAIRRINKSEYLAIVVTNQPVIARNLCSLDDLQEIHNRIEALLGEFGAYIDAIYYCPHHPDGGYPEERVEYKISCNCRKPKPGMLLKAAEEFNIDISNSYMIGDRDGDIQAGEVAGVKQSFLLETNCANGLNNIIDNLI